MALKQENIFCNSKDVLKDCYLVGFNLGTTCQRLANACVLYRECTQFDTRCGKVLLFYSNYSFSLYFFISFFLQLILQFFAHNIIFAATNYSYFLYYQACPTGRRLVQDFSLDYYTVLAGGTLDERYKVRLLFQKISLDHFIVLERSTLDGRCKARLLFQNISLDFYTVQKYILDLYKVLEGSTLDEIYKVRLLFQNISLDYYIVLEGSTLDEIYKVRF